MTLRDLYNFILDEYGKRGCWISELSDKLGICRKNANYLTYALGYRRGRALAVVPYEVFANDDNVQAIHKTI